MNVLFPNAASSGVVRNAISRLDVQAASFTEFNSEYEMESSGAGKKGMFTLKRRLAPTVTIVKPHMPTFWGKRGHLKRSAYCRRQFLAHTPFDNEAHYFSYIRDHEFDWEAAYEFFVLHDPDASPPPCCRDDFASDLTLVMDDEGTAVADDSEQAASHEGFAMFHVNSHFAHLAEPVRAQHVDWAARTANT